MARLLFPFQSVLLVIALSEFRHCDAARSSTRSAREVSWSGESAGIASGARLNAKIVVFDSAAEAFGSQGEPDLASASQCFSWTLDSSIAREDRAFPVISPLDGSFSVVNASRGERLGGIHGICRSVGACICTCSSPKRPRRCQEVEPAQLTAATTTTCVRR